MGDINEYLQKSLERIKPVQFMSVHFVCGGCGASSGDCNVIVKIRVEALTGVSGVAAFYPAKRCIISSAQDHKADWTLCAPD